MSATHLLVRDEPGSRHSTAYCGRVAVANAGIIVDPRGPHADYSDAGDGVTCKWCLRRLGLAPRITAHGAFASRVETATANAIADWLERRGDDCNPVRSAQLIRAGEWRSNTVKEPSDAHD